MTPRRIPTRPDHPPSPTAYVILNGLSIAGTVISIATLFGVAMTSPMVLIYAASIPSTFYVLRVDAQRARARGEDIDKNGEIRSAMQLVRSASVFTRIPGPLVLASTALAEAWVTAPRIPNRRDASRSDRGFRVRG